MFIPEIKDGLNQSSNAFLILLLTIIIAGIYGSFMLTAEKISELEEDHKSDVKEIKHDVEKNQDNINRIDKEVFRLNGK